MEQKSFSRQPLVYIGGNHGLFFSLVAGSGLPFRIPDTRKKLSDLITSAASAIAFSLPLRSAAYPSGPDKAS
tara:strand:- start:85999 stop:86214 length:216 start_codon:yes stop_codon:yes gene_type:complete